MTAMGLRPAPVRFADSLTVVDPTDPYVALADGTRTGYVAVASGADALGVTGAAAGDLLLVTSGSRILTPEAFRAEGGLYDGANRPYSDSNPPESLMRTVFTEPANPPAGQTVEWYDSLGILWIKDSAGVKNILTGGAICKSLSAAVTNSSTTRQDITDLRFTGLPAGTWGFHWLGTYQSTGATLTALRAAVNFSGTSGGFDYGAIIAQSASVPGLYGGSALDTPPTPAAAAVASTRYPFQMWGRLVASTAGDFNCRFAPSTGTTATIQIDRGSTLRLWKT